MAFPWEQRKLGDIGKARSGVGFPDADQGGLTGVPFFKVSDMNSDGNENEMTVANNYVTAEQIAVHRWSPITELPAIFFAKVGAAVMLNRKRLCRFPFLLDNNTMAYSLSPTKWDADFAKALFGTVDLTSLVQVGALPSYNAGDVESMEIYLPSLLEQAQIGAYFKHLDNLITLHQRKYFYKLTSAGTTRTFQNTNAWEQRKFEDLYDYASEGGTPDTNNTAFYEGGKIPFVKIEDTVEKYIDSPKSYITEEGMKHSSAWLIPKGNVIFTNGATVGNVAINRLPVTTKQGILGIIPSKKVTSEFLFYLLSSTEFQREVRSRMATGTFATIILKSLNEIPVCFPSNTNEQESIITILSRLDNLITLHQRKRILHEIQNN